MYRQQNGVLCRHSSHLTEFPLHHSYTQFCFNPSHRPPPTLLRPPPANGQDPYLAPELEPFTVRPQVSSRPLLAPTCGTAVLLQPTHPQPIHRLRSYPPPLSSPSVQSLGFVLEPLFSTSTPPPSTLKLDCDPLLLQSSSSPWPQPPCEAPRVSCAPSPAQPSQAATCLAHASPPAIPPP